MKMPLLISACLWEEGAEGLSQAIYLFFSSRSLCDSFWFGSSPASRWLTMHISAFCSREVNKGNNKSRSQTPQRSLSLFSPLHFTSWVRLTEIGEKNRLLCWQPAAVVKLSFQRTSQNKESRLLSLFPCCYLSFKPMAKPCLCHLSGLLQPSMGCMNSVLAFQVWPHHESLISESGAPQGKRKLNSPLQIPDETTNLTAFVIWLRCWSFSFFHQ